MKAIRKSFDAEPAFPFSFNFKDTKTLQLELPDHLHDWYELVYVHSGKGSFFIDRTIYEMREGDLFLIPGNTVHRAFPDKEDPITSTALFFNPLLVEQSALGEAFSYMQGFEHSNASRQYKLLCNPSLMHLFETQLAGIESEQRTAGPGCRHAIVLSIQLLLLAVNRELGSDTNGSPASIGPMWMRDILLYIDRHFCEGIGLSTLCVRASVSPAHFSRVFKQLTGMNVTAFITVKRIIRAKELLLESEDNVATIAAACGFESLPHFHRSFKQIVGMPPAAYRKSFKM